MLQIESIKTNVAPADAAKMYGLSVQRNGMARCPFHNDTHPSMKLYDDHFYCFACGAHGDVIDLTAKLLGLNFKETVHRLAVDFGISPNDDPPAAVKPQRPHVSQFRRDELLCLSTLTEYERLLRFWKQEYAPSVPNAFGVPSGTQQSGSDGERTSSGMSELSPQGGSEGYEACEDVDDRFVEACQMLEMIEYLADFLCAASLEERVKAVDELIQNGLMEKLRNHLEEVNVNERAA